MRRRTIPRSAGSIARVLALLVLPGLCGCFRNWILPPKADGYDEVDEATTAARYYGSLQTRDGPTYGSAVDVDPASVPAPRLSSNPEADELWHMTLRDALRIALENNDVMVRDDGTSAPAENPGDAENVTARTIYDPAIREHDIERQLSRFDARWETTLFWTQTDEPTSTTSNLFQGFQRDQFQGQTTLSKRLITGGTGSIGFDSNYQLRNRESSFTQSLLNPEWDTGFTIGFRQPLGAQDQNGRFGAYGVEYNRAPILIARIQADETLWQFKENLMTMLATVEEAYWNLYGSQEQRASLELAVKQSWEYVRILENEQQAGRGDPAEQAEAKAQLDTLSETLEFATASPRGRAGLRFDGVLHAEAKLRGLLRLPLNDGRRIVATDKPTISPMFPNWTATLAEAFSFRPNLQQIRLFVAENQQRLIDARGGLRPQIDVGGQWKLNGLDRRLDWSAEQLTDNRFNEWQIDVRMIVPLGYRLEIAEYEQARLQLAAAKARANQEVHRTIFVLGERFRALDYTRRQHQLALRRLDSSTRRYQINLDRLTEGAGDERRVVTLRLLQAIEGLRDATLSEIDARVQYNVELAQFELDKGTLLEYDNVHFHEGPWPEKAYRQAEEQEADRARGIPAEIPLHRTHRHLGAHAYDTVIDVTDPHLRSGQSESEPTSEASPAPAADPVVPAIHETPVPLADEVPLGLRSGRATKR